MPYSPPLPPGPPLASLAPDDASSPWGWLQAIVDHSNAVVHIKDLDGRHVLVNRRFEEVLGLARGHVLGKTSYDLFPVDVADAQSAHDRLVVESETAQEYEELVPRAGGARRLLSLKLPLRAADGQVCGVCSVSNDVTEPRSADGARPRDTLTERLVQSSADGILAFDTECRYTVWNPGMERISGLPAEQVLGRRAFDVFPFLTETGEERFFHEALAGRSSVSRDRAYTVPETGRQGFYQGHYAPVHDAEGRIVAGLAIIRDVTERRTAEQERIELTRAEAARAAAEVTARRFAFIAEAGEVLSSSLDYEQTLRDVAKLAVPMLGDFCIVDVVEGGRVRRVAATHVSPAKAELMDELRRRYPPSPESPQPAGRVLVTGRPELLAEITPEVIAAHTFDSAHAALLRALALRSHLAVPLITRGSIVGVLSLGITESDRRYDSRDEELARELARRAASAVDNARLYRAAQDELAERRRAEEALRISEARFRAVMEQSPLSTQVFAPNGATLRVNGAWEELWGLTLDQIGDYNVLADPQLEARGIAPILRRAFAGEAVEVPAHLYDPDVTIPDRTRHEQPVRWVRSFAYPVKDTEGALREVVLVHEDVTARVLAEERLRASEERLRMALSAARMNVWDWDLATDRIECSDDAREFWGTDVGHRVDFMAVVHPDDRPAVEDATRAAIAGERPYVTECRITGPGRPVRWVQSRGRLDRDSEGRPTRLLGVTVDITDLKAAEEATRVLADAGETLGASLDARATLQTLTRALVPRLADGCAVDLLTETGSLERVAVSPPDPTRGAAAGAPFRAFAPGRPDPYGAWRVIQTGEPAWVESTYGETAPAVTHAPEHLGLLRDLGVGSYVCVPLVARGATLGVLTLVHAEGARRYRPTDVELAKELARRVAAAVENARLYAQVRAEDRRKDEFLATLAHELRNPLAPIRSGLEILRLAKPGASTERTREIMERQLGHLVRLVDDLLDLSRVTQGNVQLRKEPVALSSVLATALEASGPLIDAAGVDLAVRLPEELVLDGDPTRIAQVLSNLVNNAAKYTERGGRIEVSAVRDGPNAVIRVTDTGVGIPRDMLTHVFEMFAQLGRSLERSQGGLGIGLTLVKRLVELHGGQVWAESEGPGRGSTFVVRLPGVFVEPVSAAPGHPKARPGSARSGARVLVVDDNDDAAETMTMLLELDGHEVRQASSGDAALELVREYRPDVAFLDIGLPGMSGYELARRLRGNPLLAGVKLVAVTGWAQPEDLRQSKEAGFDHHVAKPVEPREVRALASQSRR